ncbi:hypothetical protein JNL27_17385 [bacterium]|nr:hypothetical protein [bacterium]
MAFPKFVIYFVNEDKTIEETLQHDTIEEAMDDVKLLLNVGRSEWKSCEITLESSDSSLIDVDFGDESSTTG